MIRRPKNEEELQKREAIGVIRASRFIRKYAKSNKPINFAVICEVHKKIFTLDRIQVLDLLFITPFAALRAAPMAEITVAEPVTISPPA